MATTKNLKVSASTAKFIVADGALAAKQAKDRDVTYQSVIDGLWADGIRYIHLAGDKANGIEPIKPLRESIRALIVSSYAKDIQALIAKSPKDCEGPKRRDPKFHARIGGAETERRQYWAQQPDSEIGRYARTLLAMEGKKTKAASKGLDAKFAKAILDFHKQYQDAEDSMFDLVSIVKWLDPIVLHVKDTQARIEAEKAQKAAARKARGKAAK